MDDILELLQSEDHYKIAARIVEIAAGPRGILNVDDVLQIAVLNCDTIHIIDLLILLRATFSFREHLEKWVALRDHAVVKATREFSEEEMKKVFTGLL